MRFRELLSEKIIQKERVSYMGKKVVNMLVLHNPSRSEIQAALNNSAEGDLRGILLAPDDFYVADAAFHSHTDVAEKYHNGEWKELVRIIVTKDETVVADIFEQSDPDNIRDPQEAISIIKNSKVLMRIFRPGTHITVRSYNNDWSKMQSGEYTL